MQHTFLYISLPLFCTTTTWNFQKLPSYTFYGGNVVCGPVHFLSLPFILTLVAASISHFLTAAIKFSCNFSKKLVFFVFLSLALAFFLLSRTMYTLKLSRKKKFGFVDVVFYLWKWLCDLLPKRAGTCKISPRLTWRGGRTYGRTPYLRFSQNPNFLDA